MNRTARLLVTTAVALSLIVVGVGATAASPGAESDFVSRVNAARSSRGAGPLAEDAELTAIARRWAQKMAGDNRLSHNPNLSREVSQDWEKLAENVGFGGDVASIHDAFMNSSAHRTNILDATMTHVGIGVVSDGSGQLWVTEVFMRLRGGGGGGGSTPTTAAPPPTTPAATSPPTTARPRPAPAPTTPPTTAAPRPVPTTAPPPPPAPEALVAPPEPTPPPDEAVEAASASAEAAAPAAPSTPSMRLQLVLDGLVALDQGR